MAVPIAVQVGRTRVLVQTLPVTGTEPTSGKADKAAEHVLGAFERAQEAIVEVAASTVHVIERAAQRSARPDRLELEFGISFSAKGDVIVAGVAGQASLLVRLVYERNGADGAE